MRGGPAIARMRPARQTSDLCAGDPVTGLDARTGANVAAGQPGGSLETVTPDVADVIKRTNQYRIRRHHD
jgi:hypothetical protein